MTDDRRVYKVDQSIEVVYIIELNPSFETSIVVRLNNFKSSACFQVSVGCFNWQSRFMHPPLVSSVKAQTTETAGPVIHCLTLC